ncbi:MAG: phosphatidate cytidylyltransferase [bacterium]|nr:phosphatidate cytidylyltransferase [bacterium]
MIARILSSVAMIAAALFLLFKGGSFLLTSFAVFGAIMSWEIVRAKSQSRSLQVAAILVTIGLLYALSHFWTLRFWYSPIVITLIILLYAAMVFELGRKYILLPDNPMLLLIRSVVIPVVGLSFVFIIRESYGVWFALLFFCAIWGSDIAALLGGKTFGKTRLTDISPNKTIEGSIFGIVGSLVLTASLAAGVGISVKLALITGIGVSVLAQIGDLHESLYKRRCGIKDSSAIIPGHGGVYDRLDSTVFSAPAYFYVLGLLA